MDRLRQAVGNTIREADGVVHQSKHRGHQAAIYDAAKSVLDAPRIWLCEVYWEVWYGPRTACVYSPTQHSKCRWVRLVDDPQEGGEE